MPLVIKCLFSMYCCGLGEGTIYRNDTEGFWSVWQSLTPSALNALHNRAAHLQTGTTFPLLSTCIAYTPTNQVLCSFLVWWKFGEGCPLVLILVQLHLLARSGSTDFWFYLLIFCPSQDTTVMRPLLGVLEKHQEFWFAEVWEAVLDLSGGRATND